MNKLILCFITVVFIGMSKDIVGLTKRLLRMWSWSWLSLFLLWGWKRILQGFVRLGCRMWMILTKDHSQQDHVQIPFTTYETII